ncbi:MAG: hypothetical protein ACFB10_18070 [Salibacteraceae bacterium]
MKRIFSIIYLIYFAIILQSCVQNTKEQTVIFEVDMKAETNVKSVHAIINVISQDNQKLELRDEDLDSIYKGEIVLDIPFGEIKTKFVKNDSEMELTDKDSRVVKFSESGKTVYTAVFNKL